MTVFKVSNSNTHKILNKLHDSNSILGKPFHERQQLYQMQVKNKTDELEYNIYSNKKAGIDSERNNSKKMNLDRDQEVYHANKGSEKIIKKLQEKDHYLSKPFLERQSEHVRAMKSKKDEMAKIIYKNASFAPKIND